MGLFAKIGAGIDTVCKAIWKGFVALLKAALYIGIFIIYGIYRAASGLLDYAKRAAKRIKEKFAGSRPKEVTSIGGKKFKEAIAIIKEGATEGEPIDLATLEEVEEKIDNEEISGACVCEGNTANGEEAVLDIEFIKAREMDQNEVYHRQIV